MEISDIEFRTLIHGCASGDTEKFKELYEHLVDRVFSYIRYRTNTEDIATDLTQDVFVGLWGSLPNFSYRSRAEFYAYVFQIVRRTLARHYGNKHTQGEKERVDVDEALFPSNGSDESSRLDVRRALLTLDPVSRDVVVLHHWSGYTFGEIGEMLGSEESAVRVRHHRAMKKLKSHFA